MPKNEADSVLAFAGMIDRVLCSDAGSDVYSEWRCIRDSGLKVCADPSSTNVADDYQALFQFVRQTPGLYAKLFRDHVDEIAKFITDICAQHGETQKSRPLNEDEMRVMAMLRDLSDSVLRFIEEQAANAEG